MKIETYEHHGAIVSVRSDLKGKHREHCLCFSCKLFVPGKIENCDIAQDVYDNCVSYDIVTPVWECPAFAEGEPKLAELETKDEQR